jgi:hypothetical protein
MRTTERLSRPMEGRTILRRASAASEEPAESTTDSVAAPVCRAIPAGAMPRPDPRRFIDNMAIGDARADVAAGSSQLYDGMERLFICGDITRAAWQRYRRTYRAECLWLLPQREALSQVVAAGSPA